MLLRIALVGLSCFLFHCEIWGQSPGKFKLPPGVSTSDYESGIVWVKLKSQHKGILEATTGRRVGTNINATAVSPLVTTRVREKNAARMAPRNARIDISLYYKISYDRSGHLEDYINELYATGYFDIVEPVYGVEPFSMPDDPLRSQQYYLDLIRAPEAWDISTGDPSVVIGIVDTGGDLNHPDLQGNLYIDPAEPLDGIDNDGDGFIDNDRGWDFSGADAALIGTPGFIGDNDPSIAQGGLFSHGTLVAGCASAATNNGVGIASVGYNTKLLFTKHFADSQAPSETNYSSNTYDGMLYAATHGAKIINCSWGGYNRSTIAQDIITYVTFDLGCLVVAAAGNSNLEAPIYPASYDYVLSVAATDESDVRTKFSNFGKTIDITAPGIGIYTTAYDNAYGSDSGTSLSAPIVSGAAALVWAQNPLFTPLQVAEQVRVSADESIYEKNPAYLHKLGKGRLDVLRALTIKTPSIRAANQVLVSDNGQFPDPGESAKLYFDFTNYLQPSSTGLAATLSSSSPYLTINEAQITLGVIDEKATVTNSATPFEISLSAIFPVDEPVEALLTFSDGSYQDFQLVSFIIPSYIDVDENNIITSITPSGRIGFGDFATQSGGSGFLYNEESILYEMGLIMGTSASDLFNNVRGINDQFDEDFVSTTRLVKMTPGQRSYSEVTGGLRNDEDVALASLEIAYQSLVWNNDPYRNFIILEYKVKNTTATPIADFYFGMFADWDIALSGGGDRASWDSETKLGYVYPAQPSILPRSGIQVLSGDAQYYAIDNDPTIAGNPFGIYDGFTDAEKFMTVSSGIAKIDAGDPTTGNDVSQVVSSGPFAIEPGQEVTIAFALHAANTNEALITSAKYADSLYNYTLKATQPDVEAVKVCEDTPATIRATGAGSFNWYREFTGGEPIFNGPEFTTPDLLRDTVFYVSNADEHYESVRSMAAVSVVPAPVITASGSTELCDGEAVTLSAGDGDEYAWNIGETTREIAVEVAGQYSVQVRYNDITCASSVPAEVTVKPTPSAAFTVFPEMPTQNEVVSFSSLAADGVTWRWDFGDGDSSTVKQPDHIYVEEGDFVVTLQITSENGCRAMGSKTFGIITGLESNFDQPITVYPNPVRTNEVSLLNLPAKGHALLFDVRGKEILVDTYALGDRTVLDTSHLSNGVYILKISVGQTEISRKIIIAR